MLLAATIAVDNKQAPKIAVDMKTMLLVAKAAVDNKRAPKIVLDNKEAPRIAADMKQASRWLIDLAIQNNTRVFEATTGMFAGPDYRGNPMFVQWIYSRGMPGSPEKPIDLQETLEREIRFALQPEDFKLLAREGSLNTFLR